MLRYGPGFNPHHIKLSGLEVSPLKVSGGSPVHLRSKRQELVGRPSGSKKEKIYIMLRYVVVRISGGWVRSVRKMVIIVCI